MPIGHRPLSQLAALRLRFRARPHRWGLLFIRSPSTRVPASRGRSGARPRRQPMRPEQAMPYVRDSARSSGAERSFRFRAHAISLSKRWRAGCQRAAAGCAAIHGWCMDCLSRSTAPSSARHAFRTGSGRSAETDYTGSSVQVLEGAPAQARMKRVCRVRCPSFAVCEWRWRHLQEPYSYSELHTQTVALRGRSAHTPCTPCSRSIHQPVHPCARQ